MENEKQRIETEEKCVQLTEDLMIEIISRVSVKDIIRFTCVSKSWCSLITTGSHLSKLQFQRTASLNPPSLVIQKDEDVSTSNNLYYNHLFDFGSLEDENINLREIHNPFDEDNNDDCPRRDARVEGSCDGLLVLQQRPSLKMVVLNPTTTNIHVVPTNPAGDDKVIFFGFGHDHVRDCYKLVTKVDTKDHIIELMIYNVNSGTWRRSQFDDFDDDDYYSSLFYPGIYLDGALYWCNDLDTRTSEVMKIICFDLGEEEFGELETPDFGEVINKPNMYVFDGKLCLVCEGSDCLDMWIMNYKTEKACGRWVKFLSIPNHGSIKIIPSCLSDPMLSPICFSACSKRILFQGDFIELFWYDIENKIFSEVTNIEFSNFSIMSMFVPSLIRNGIL